MLRTVIVEAWYPRDPDALFAELCDLAEMKEAMARIAHYEGLPERPVKEGDRFSVDVTLYGFIKTRDHVMEVERLDVPGRLIQSREHNPQVRRWDHTLTVEPEGDGALWRDLVVLDAGWQTPLTARFCRHVYGHRHRTRGADRITRRILRGDRATPLHSVPAEG
ncbi:hypothetical protein [Jannaschia marina]|uniref:hypothetical protein n=1 Tax=Jannaschia marina TaxID=2741674 RepID=UPI0015CA8F6C|nr:hypothetical protein [Jannaschia marina]